MFTKPKSDNSFGTAFALTPLDGRNRHKLHKLTNFFSDFALNRYRIIVEVQYFIALSKVKGMETLSQKQIKHTLSIIDKFDREEYEKIRVIEEKVNHDVKAVEEYLKSKLSPMVHFGLTSDDINNLAYAMMIKRAIYEVLTPELKKINKILSEKIKAYKDLPLLGRTHGQAAIPTTLGKELFVYYKRLADEIKILGGLKIKGKLMGNIGNLNVHKFLYPQTNWLEFSSRLVTSLGLDPDMVTTQIEPYDSLIRIFDTFSRINNILHGLCVDMWTYTMLGYLKQTVIKTEVGSTALPHKVNPIYFEGGEGGLGLANALFDFYHRKLSYSRLQRDLSDSTVRRSFGTAFGYSLLSYKSIQEGLGRISADEIRINGDLNNHWEIMSEVIQNFLRMKNYKDAYEKTKLFFRGKKISKPDVENFIKQLKLAKSDEDKLLNISPDKYIGYAVDIIDL